MAWPVLRAWPALFLLTACSAAKTASGLLVHPLRVPVVAAPPVPHEALTVTTVDGLALHGWLFRPEGPPRGLVVLVHGKDINRTHLASYGVALVKQGYAVAAYDQRAHGQSEGTCTTYGAREVDDLRRVIDAVGITPVTLIGESLGAATAIQAAAVDPRVDHLVSAASFASLRVLLGEIRPKVFPEGTVDEAIGLAEAECHFEVDAIAPVKAAARVTVPTLVIHGLSDDFIAMHHALELYAALPGPKQLLQLENVGHQDVLLHREVWEQIERFLAAETAIPRP